MTAAAHSAHETVRDADGYTVYGGGSTKKVWPYEPPARYDRNLVEGAAQPIIIVDIDGTVALRTGSRNFFDWDRVHEDELNEPVANLVELFHETGFNVVYMSGRSDACHDLTRRWLEGHGLWYPTAELHMRTHGDYRPDWVVKLELFDAHVRTRYHVEYVLDDRNEVVRLWRDLGLVCLQVADGNF